MPKNKLYKKLYNQSTPIRKMTTAKKLIDSVLIDNLTEKEYIKELVVLRRELIRVKENSYSLTKKDYLEKYAVLDALLTIYIKNINGSFVITSSTQEEFLNKLLLWSKGVSF